MRKAVVRQSDGYVVNVIEWEEGTSWQPPEGCILMDGADASPSDTWDGKKFIKPIIEPVPEPRNLTVELDNLKAWAKGMGYKEPKSV